MRKIRTHSVNRGLADDPQWYKDAIIYELRVRSFYDTSGDGIGDFGLSDLVFDLSWTEEENSDGL